MQINLWAVILSALASLVIGFIWYGPLFGKAWMKVAGMDNITPEMREMMKKKMAGMLFLQAVLSTITAYVLALFMNMTGAPSIATAFWVWFGFVMTIIGGAALWSGKTPKLAWMMFFIMSGCQLVTFLAYGGIITAFN